MDRLAFCASLLALTFAYGLILSLTGSCLLDSVRQRRWESLVPALGLLVFYPLSVIGTIWLRPSLLLAFFLAALLAMWVRLWIRERAAFQSRIVAAAQQAAWIAGLAVLFWAPGAIGQNVGLFSEASGDLTIYAGLPEKVGDAPLWPRVQIKEVSSDLFAGRLWTATGEPSAGAEPPAAGWSMQRIVDLNWAVRDPGWFALQHVLSPIRFGNVEVRYLALLATLWALIVAVVFRIVLLRGSRLAAMLALLIMIGSHNLAAVGYNHYFLELLSSALLVALLAFFMLADDLRLSRWSMIALSIVTTVSVGVVYYPMLPALLVPLVFGALYRYKRITPLPERLAEKRGPLERAARTARTPLVIVGLLLLLLPAFAGLEKATQLLASVIAPTAQTRIDLMSRLAPPKPYDIDQLASLLGAFSLHRLAPYDSHDPASLPATWIVAAAGTLVFALIFFSVLRRLMQIGLRSAFSTRDEDIRFYASFTLALLAYLVIQLYVGRSYAYTQYKAIAYVLPFVLFYLCLPLPTLAGPPWTGRAFTIAKLFFAGGLLFFRVEGGTTIAQGREQAGVLDVGVSRLTHTIQSRDARAFTLVYPPKAALFSLWEFGLRAQRAIIMKYYVYPKGKERYLSAPDVQHLWVFGTEPPPQRFPDVLHDRSLWAYRPLSSSTCTVATTALQEERPRFVPYALLNHPSEPLWQQNDNEFWVFNATSERALLLALKVADVATASSKVAIEIAYPIRKKLSLPIASREDKDVLVRIPRAVWPNALGAKSTDLLVLRLPSAGYSGLFCGNERIERPVLSQAAVLTVEPSIVKRGRSITAHWSGLTDPDKNDWIGLFPVGGADASRSSFRFIGASVNGSATLVIPANLPTGSYLVRFFRRGLWERAASSAPFSVR